MGKLTDIKLRAMKPNGKIQKEFDGDGPYIGPKSKSISWQMVNRQRKLTERLSSCRELTGVLNVNNYSALQHFVFETLHSAWPAKVNFAYASWAGGGAPRLRRQSNFKVKLL